MYFPKSLLSILFVLILLVGIFPAQKAGAANSLNADDWSQLRALSPSLAALTPATLQAYLKSSNSQAGDNFGVSMSLSGDTLVVGATSEDSNAAGVNGDGTDNSLAGAGAAYVFVRNAGVWSQQAYLKASNPDANDLFGGAVAIDGDTIVVGARQEGSSSTGVNGNQANNTAGIAGAAYVFTRSAGVWSQQAYLKASNTASLDQFGFSVAISGDTIAVGAPAEDSSDTGVNGNSTDNTASASGAVYVFIRNAGSWTQQGYVKASNTGASDQFGISVGVAGDTLVVGAVNEASNATGVNGNQADNSVASAGAAYVFTRSVGMWSQQAYLKASNPETGDDFGQTVAISGNTIAVGAHFEDGGVAGINGNQADNSALSSGAVYVFTNSAGIWSQQAYVKASNPGGSDHFGVSLALSGNTLLVGSNLEDSNATGPNGVQADESALNSGAAYLFTRSGTTWSQDVYLKSSNSEAGDDFGVSVALSGDTFAVGSDSEDSDATSVNGDGSNNLASISGAGYVYSTVNTLTLNSLATQDGFVLESTETSGVGGTLNSTATTFQLGDDATNKQYRAVLHFDTSSLPDTAVITKVTLKIKKQALTGTDPFTTHGALRVDVSKPSFGTTALQLTDFQVAAGSASVASFGATPVSNVYSAVLNAAGRAKINLTGTTQFRLRFLTDDNNDLGADFMKFFSGNYGGAASRPTLVIEYH